MPEPQAELPRCGEGPRFPEMCGCERMGRDACFASNRNCDEGNVPQKHGILGQRGAGRQDVSDLAMAGRLFAALPSFGRRLRPILAARP
jgi:hypothetical protein